MKLQEFIDRLNQLPPEVKAMEIGFFDFGHEDMEWLNDYLNRERYRHWSGEKDETFVIC